MSTFDSTPASWESLCTLCPQSGCFTRRAADLALRGERPYLEGCCTVCNYVFWKSRSAKDGVKALDTGDKRRRRSVGRAAREALEAIIDAGAISCGSAYAFWLKNLRELHDLSGAGPGTDYTLRMVFPPGRAWKPEVILDVAWKWNGSAGCRGREGITVAEVAASLKGFAGEHGLASAEALVTELTR